MKLFGRYLVNQGLVSEEALLAALVRQQESVPSVASIVHRGALLSQEKQLAVFQHQWRTGAEYRRAALELGFWSETLQLEIKRRLIEQRKPLGQIMVEAGNLSLAQLTIALDAFLAARGIKELPPAVAGDSHEDSPVDARSASYCTLFDEELLERLRTLVGRLPASHEDLKQLVQPLRFLCKFLDLKTSAAAWAEFEKAPHDETLAKLWRLRLGLVERRAA